MTTPTQTTQIARTHIVYFAAPHTTGSLRPMARMSVTKNTPVGGTRRTAVRIPQHHAETIVANLTRRGFRARVEVA
jgi:hypothetical protein